MIEDDRFGKLAMRQYLFAFSMEVYMVWEEI